AHANSAEKARTRVRSPLESRGTIRVTPREELRVSEHRRGSNQAACEWAEQDGSYEPGQDRYRLLLCPCQSSLRDGESDADPLSNCCSDSQSDDCPGRLELEADCHEAHSHNCCRKGQCEYVCRGATARFGRGSTRGLNYPSNGVYDVPAVSSQS